MEKGGGHFQLTCDEEKAGVWIVPVGKLFAGWSQEAERRTTGRWSARLHTLTMLSMPLERSRSPSQGWKSCRRVCEGEKRHKSLGIR